MYTMKEVCDQVGLTYETLRFYCNEGLVPNVKRDKNNYRIFDERNVHWLKSLQCLKMCGMSIQDMKNYMSLCLEGSSSIPERKKLLAVRKEFLLNRMDELNKSIEYIDGKLEYFDGVLAGRIEYTSNLYALPEADAEPVHAPDAETMPAPENQRAKKGRKPESRFDKVQVGVEAL